LADIVTTADLRDHLEAINEALEKLVAIQENESQAPRHDS
jgi:hypothetical protein